MLGPGCKPSIGGRSQLFTRARKHLPLGEAGTNHRKRTPDECAACPPARPHPCNHEAGAQGRLPPPSPPCRLLSCCSNWKATCKRHLPVKRPSWFSQNEHSQNQGREGTEHVLRAACFTRRSDSSLSFLVAQSPALQSGRCFLGSRTEAESS